MLPSERSVRPSGNGTSPVAVGWVILAGTDLVHRYYSAGNSDPAASVLAEIHELQNLTPQAAVDQKHIDSQ